MITTRRDALIWNAVDRMFSGADKTRVLRDLELDLLRERADRLLTQRDKLIALLRETDPKR